jgi:hypothetical protein
MVVPLSFVTSGCKSAQAIKVLEARKQCENAHCAGNSEHLLKGHRWPPQILMDTIFRGSFMIVWVGLLTSVQDRYELLVS